MAKEILATEDRWIRLESFFLIGVMKIEKID